MHNDIKKLQRIMRQANYLNPQSPANGNKSFALREAWKIQHLRDHLDDGVVVFKYRKVDGSIRLAVGTRNVKFFVPEDCIPKGGQNENVENFRVVPYYDLQAQGWRSFRIDQLVDVCITYLPNYLG